MKRKLAILSSVIVTIAGAASANAATGKIVDGRTLVPVRGAFEELGFNVDWDSETSTAYISDDDNIVEITKGLNYIVANGNNIIPDVPQQIIDDRFYLPLRAVGESVGANVQWDGATKTAHISYNGKDCYVNCGAEAAKTASVSSETENFDGSYRAYYTYNNRKYEDIITITNSKYVGDEDDKRLTGDVTIRQTIVEDTGYPNMVGAYTVVDASLWEVEKSTYQIERNQCIEKSAKYSDSIDDITSQVEGGCSFYRIEGNTWTDINFIDDDGNIVKYEKIN